MISTKMRRESEMVRVSAETSDVTGRVTKREHDMTPYKVDKLTVNGGTGIFLYEIYTPEHVFLICTYTVNLAKPVD